MKLSEFIIEHLEEILAEWEAFAKATQPSTGNMSAAELRDHGSQILERIAEQIKLPQSPEQQEQKSKGLAPYAVNKETPAGEHGGVRQQSGFTMVEVISEYRAVRASVLKLWIPTIKEVTDETSESMLRFNEAIDQALAESAITYEEHAGRTRDTFLAVLGHDLRSPLATISMAGAYLMQPEKNAGDIDKIGRRVKRSAATMTAMVNDLLEYARKQLGGKMPIRTQLGDMKKICQEALEDASAAHPDCDFEFTASGELLDDLDSARIQQVLSNLLNNAAQYRGQHNRVALNALGDEEAITVEVINHGPVIPAHKLKVIFEPLVQLSDDDHQTGRPSTSLGLGLYIAKEITQAHGGTLSVESNEDTGTIFTVKLPRR